MMSIKARWRFADEAPRIGCGERGVNVLVGRKWVRIVERSTGNRVKLPVEVFEKLKPRRMV